MSDDKQKKPSASTVLVGLALDRYDLGLSEAGATYAVPKYGPKIVRLLRGGRNSLRAELARLYYDETGHAASQSALADALAVIEGKAQQSVPARLWLRVAEHDGAQWLDLGDSTGRAVKISAGKWEVTDQVPVLFQRTALTLALPEPAQGADLKELWAWINCTEEDRPLVLAQQVAQLVPDVAHVVVGVFGEHGTGKTSMCSALTRVMDPAPVPTRKAPRDPDAWVVAAAGSWVVALDNLSDMPAWLSDSICRASTGTGDVRRKLYTDEDLAVIAFRRSVIINGIDLGGLKGDLADRLLTLDLVVIPKADRKTDTEIWADWTAAHPRLLGALLDFAARVLHAMPGITLHELPRMADYARVLAATDHVLRNKGAGWERYAARASDLARDTLSASPFASRIIEVITAEWTGSAGDLLACLTPMCEPDGRPWQRPRGWPASARKVTVELNNLAPVFRKTGWQVTSETDKHTKNNVWTLTPPEDAGDTGERDGNQPPQPPRSPQDGPPPAETLAVVAPETAVIAGNRPPQTTADAAVAVVEPPQDNTTTAQPPQASSQVSGGAAVVAGVAVVTDASSPVATTCPGCGEPHNRYGPDGRPCRTAPAGGDVRDFGSYR